MKKAFRTILSPHISEKTSGQNASGVYAFKVGEQAGKTEIKEAVRELYGVKPLKVNLIRIPAKKRLIRGKVGKRPGYKKALVFLKEGDSIQIT